MIKFVLSYVLLMILVFGVFSYIKSTVTDLRKLKSFTWAFLMSAGVITIASIILVMIVLLF